MSRRNQVETRKSQQKNYPRPQSSIFLGFSATTHPDYWGIPIHGTPRDPAACSGKADMVQRRLLGAQMKVKFSSLEDPEMNWI